ncbi:MAG: presqualene diphosphate synthase HpnD [Calditrichota bacterium]
MNTQTDQQITLDSQSSFLYSFFLLPKDKRQAIYTLYAFCRQTDDIADTNEPTEKRWNKLEDWESDLKYCFTSRAGNYFDSVRAVSERFKIPFEYFLELIAGVRMDLNDLDYRSFDDLKLYCYRVASIVGLMCIQIFGYRDPVIKKYAENLGIALQLTNIIRDVGTDAKLGRIYIPEEELKQFGVDKKDLFENRYSDNFEQLMTFQSERAHLYYKLADECLPASEQRNMLVSEIMKDIYFHLLTKIDASQYQVLDNIIKVSKPKKIWLTMKTVSRIKLLAAPAV